MTEYLLLAFESTHAAIAAQKALHALDIVVMPTLREISASCGISIKLPAGSRQAAAESLDAANVGQWTLYLVREANANAKAGKATGDIELVEKRSI